MLLRLCLPAPQVVVPLPDAEGRGQITAVHLRGVPLEPELEPSIACQVGLNVQPA
jgi:ATP-dependent Zn protease